MVKRSTRLLSAAIASFMIFGAAFTTGIPAIAKTKTVKGKSASVRTVTKAAVSKAKASAASSYKSVKTASAAKEERAKNVIVLMGDGMNASEITLTRWFNGADLALDGIVTGEVKNYNSNSVITDSAPAATAFATGYKTDAGYVSVYPSEITVPEKKEVDEKDAYKPLATILEAAKLSGKSTGIVSTSQVQHASPAGFSAHNYNRNDYYDIAKQQVYENMDVVLGGGKEYLLPFDVINEKDSSGNQIGRKDGINLVDEIKDLGYTYVEDSDSLNKANGNKIWGMFANEGMSYDYDRNPAKEPSLDQMTSKAISTLSKNKDGFFLFIEGSEIDWASHANDPVGVISDTLAFDKAVKTALDFAKKDKNTLVLAFTDHGCGGMTIGNASTNKGYDTLQLDTLLAPLKKAKLTGAGLEQKLYSEVNADRSNIKDIVSKYYGIDNLTDNEVNAIKDYLKAKKTGSLNYIVGPMITTRSAIGWTTTGHTGEDITLYSYGPGKLSGLIDNTDIAKGAAKAMGISLNDTNTELYTNISDSISYIPGASADLDITDPINPVLVITKGNITAELPISTNKVIINGKVKYAEGLTLLTKSGDIYTSWDALDIVKDAK